MHFAGGQLAVFQGAHKTPSESGSRRPEMRTARSSAMKLNGRHSETDRTGGGSAFTNLDQVGQDLGIVEPVLQRDRPSAYADPPTRRSADTFPLP